MAALSNSDTDFADQLESEAKYRDEIRVAHAVPPSQGKATTEPLLAEILKTLKEQGEVTAQAHEDDKKENIRKNINDKKQDYTASMSQITLSGSFIAIFLSVLNVALLSYANDIFSERDASQHAKPTEKYVIACWTFSLVMSVAVVTSASFWSFLRFWVTAARYTPPQWWHGPWIKLDRTRRPPTIADSASEDSSKYRPIPSRFQVMGVLSAIAFSFNLLILPALVATIIGCIIFMWAEQPKLAAVLTSAVGATVLMAFLVVSVLVAGLATFRMREIRTKYEFWDEEKASLENAEWR